MRLHEQNDFELWQAIKKGDKSAFDALFERYWSAMFASAYNYLRDPDLCSDIVHDVFLNIWEKRNALDIHSVKSYLIGSVRYHFFKSLRNRKNLSMIYVENYDDHPSSNLLNEGEHKLHHTDLERIIRYQLEHLPPRCREIFILSRIENLSNEKIAEHFGISKRTVENQLTHALKFLRLHLKDIAVVLLLAYLND